MAFGFPASYATASDLAGDRVNARAGVIYALNVLRWEYSQIDPDRFRARVPFSPQSWGETFLISIEDGTIAIKSVCIVPFQLFDWGKNKQNVHAFLAHYLPKEARDTVLRSNDPANLNEAEDTPLERVLRSRD